MPGIQDRSQILRGSILYLLLAYGITWAILIPMIKAGVGEAWLNIALSGPAVAAMILSRTLRRIEVRFNARRFALFVLLTPVCWFVLERHFPVARGNAWLLIIPAVVPAWILSGALSVDSGVRLLIRRLTSRPTLWTLLPLLCWFLLLMVPAGIARSLHQPLTRPVASCGIHVAIAQALTFFAFNLLFVGVEEEPGWRGFLLDRLQLRFSPLLASLMVWLPWSLWHAPLDWYRPVRFSLVTWLLIRVIMAIPINILLAWFYNRSGRSIQSTAMFHAAMNTFPSIFPYYAPGFALVFLWAAYAVFEGRMWRRLRSASSPEFMAERPAFATSREGR